MTKMSSWGAAPHGSPETCAKYEEIPLQYLPPYPSFCPALTQKCNKPISSFLLYFSYRQANKQLNARGRRPQILPAKPLPVRAQTASLEYWRKRKRAKLSWRSRGVPGMGEGLEFLECNTKNRICMNLNETSPGSTSQPGSGSGVPSIQVLASKFPQWIFFFFRSFSFPLSLSGERCTMLAACHAHVCLPLHPHLPLFPISLGNSTENN